MSDRYYSPAQAICLAAWGSTEMPAQPDGLSIREHIETKWGKQILQDIQWIQDVSLQILGNAIIEKIHVRPLGLEPRTLEV